MPNTEEMTTLQIYHALMESIDKDRSDATALRTHVTSGTGRAIHSEKVRGLVEAAYREITTARELVMKSHDSLSSAVAYLDSAELQVNRALAKA